MKIVCEKCSAEHTLEPPDWVVSSGRSFRFRCASCGHTQMVPPPTNIQLPSSQPPADARVVTAGTHGPTAAPPPGRQAIGDALYLKQDGKVYLVKDWATLERWVEESRVGPEDLVSTEGVRWEPVSTRPELAANFQPDVSEKTPINPEPPPIAVPTPFPFGGDTPFEANEETPSTTGLESAADVEGVPVGLPPLPAIDTGHSGATASEATRAPEDTQPVQSSLLDPPVSSIAEDDGIDEPTPIESPSGGDELITDPDFASHPRADEDAEDTDWDVPRVRSQAPLVVAAIATVLIVVAVIALAVKGPRATDAGDEPQLGSVLATNPEPQPKAAPAPDPEPVEAPDPEADTDGGVADVEPSDLTPEPADVPDPVPAPVALPAPVPAPRPAPTPDPEPVPLPEPTSAPQPQAQPAPEPAPEPAGSGDPTDLIDVGWGQVDSGDLPAAAATFREALGASPSDPVANFGYGYVLVSQGKVNDATGYLCTALSNSGADVQTQREVQAVINEYDLSCP